MKQKKISRRRFLAATTATGVFSIVPRHVLGGPNHTPPSEKLNIAGVGAGGQCGNDIRPLADLNQNIVALCDVDWKKAAGIFNQYPNARKYRDFRVMLDKEEKNIDAVVVAPPDHMHAPISLRAMKMGKHVYCEKPLTHTVWEAREMARVAREQKVATQMGNQGQAGDGVRVLAEYIAAGAIGKVREVHQWCDRSRGGAPWPQAIKRPKGTPPVPKELSWDLWLGVAPERPYHPAYHPFKWRGWYDFGTGALGDIGCHAFHPIFKALDLGYPTSIEPCTTELHEETWPLVSMIRYKFPPRSDNMPALTLTWYDGMMRPPAPPELEQNRKMGNSGVMYVGDDGKILNNRIIPESRHKAFEKPPKTLPRSVGHYKEFVIACKGREPAGSNFEYAAKVTESVLLGNVALRVQRKIEWDHKKGKITNIPEANKFLTKEYRTGWTL